MICCHGSQVPKDPKNLFYPNGSYRGRIHKVNETMAQRLSIRRQGYAPCSYWRFDNWWQTGCICLTNRNLQSGYGLRNKNCFQYRHGPPAHINTGLRHIWLLNQLVINNNKIRQLHCIFWQWENKKGHHDGSPLNIHKFLSCCFKSFCSNGV